MHTNTTVVTPFYTITQLSKIIGYSREGTRRYVKRLSIPLHYTGNKTIIYLSDLSTYAPELYASLVQVEQLRNSSFEPVEPMDFGKDPIFLQQLVDFSK